MLLHLAVVNSFSLLYSIAYDCMTNVGPQFICSFYFHEYLGCFQEFGMILNNVPMKCLLVDQCKNFCCIRNIKQWNCQVISCVFLQVYSTCETVLKRVVAIYSTISAVGEFLMLHAIKDKRLQTGWIFPAPCPGQEIQSRRKFKVLNSMAFNVVTELCTHQHNQLQNIFITLK